MTDIAIPFNQEAEVALLGCVMLDGGTLVEVSSILRDESDFYFIRHQLVYRAMLDVMQRDNTVDPIAISQRLEATGDIDTVGGLAFLLTLANEVPSITRTPIYAHIVKRMAIRRNMMVAADKMKKLAQSEDLDIESVRANCDSVWLNATSDVAENKGDWISEIISDVYDDVERATLTKEMAGISTGLRDVDALMRGFEPEQLIILAGRPGMGKSAAMDNIALNIAMNDIPVFFATSERSQKQVVRRMAAIYTGIPSMKLQDGNLSPQEAAQFTRAVGRIAKLPIYVDDNPMPRVRDIHAQADWMIRRHGCKVILFDGMYRAHTGISDIDRNDHKKYGTIALELKTMARKLGVPVVTTHQLNRAVDARADKRPRMSDLRESGRIEEEADKIMFLYRDEYYNEATEFPNQADWILAKHREGSTGTVATHFNARLTKFSDATVTTIDLNALGD